MKQKHFLALTVLCCCCLAAQAQSVDSALAKYAAAYLPEKVFVHFDKASYYPGQTIWFKAYIQEDGLPAGSKTFYADWVTEDGKVLHHSVSPVVDGMTNGQFDVPDDYNGKFIQLRAYTKWMLNFDSAFLYSKDIRIVPSAAAQRNAVRPAQQTSLSFFPEGGDLVAGLPCKLAFKATDQWGRPVKIRGVLTDKKGTVIDSLRVQHNGMGHVLLTPAEGNSYAARWKDDKGVEQNTSIPNAKPSGLSMQVSISGSKRIVSLQTKLPLAAHLQQVHIVGTLNQRMAFQTTAAFSEAGALKRVIPTENLMSGVLTITVFDAAWNAVAERITFINNEEYRFSTQMEVQHWGLSKRGKNELEFKVPDNIAGAMLSVAVTDASIDVDSSEHIYSALLLSNDIRGYVHNPAYYFSNTSDSIQQQLDLVMLTNGWRRFQWNEITKGKMPVLSFPRDTAYLALSGSVYGVAKSLLTGKEAMFLLIKGKDSGTNSLLVPLAANGTFRDPNFVFFDTLRVYYQLKSKLLGSAEAKFMTDRLPTPNYSLASRSFLNRRSFMDTSGYYRHYLLAQENLKLIQQQKTKMLQTVTVTSRVKTPVQAMDEKYARGLFSGGDAQQFDLVNDPSAIGRLDIFNYLQGRVAGLQINTTSSPPSLTWRGGAPQLYLDEMPIDAGFVSSVPINDVAYIKVFRPPFFGPGGNGGNGAIAIYTRRGNDQKPAPGGGLSSSMVMGYTPIREFYSPNYSRFDQRNEQPDIRTTLYWNPGVIVGKGKPAKITFYNNDVSKAFRVTVMGMTKDGLLTRHQELME